MSPFILVCALSSCAPHYDATTDALLVNTQQKLDAGLLRLETDRKLLDEAASGGSANADAASVQEGQLLRIEHWVLFRCRGLSNYGRRACGAGNA